jgi:DNA-binding NarL/FixJ family response regulator
MVILGRLFPVAAPWEKPMTSRKAFSILLVDDDELMAREHLRVCGELPGVRVIGVAKNGAEALKLVKTMAPDLVLLDLVMPDVDGFVALRLLMRGLPDSRVAVLSSRAEEPEVREHCRQNGAVASLMKPLSASTLETVINAELRRVRPEKDGRHVL